MEAKIITKPDWTETARNMRRGEYLEFPVCRKGYMNVLRSRLRTEGYRFALSTVDDITMMMCTKSPKDE